LWRFSYWTLYLSVHIYILTSASEFQIVTVWYVPTCRNREGFVWARLYMCVTCTRKMCSRNHLATVLVAHEAVTAARQRPGVADFAISDRIGVSALPPYTLRPTEGDKAATVATQIGTRPRLPLPCCWQRDHQLCHSDPLRWQQRPTLMSELWRDFMQPLGTSMKSDSPRRRPCISVGRVCN
jgi:hypothetical protein